MRHSSASEFPSQCQLLSNLRVLTEYNYTVFAKDSSNLLCSLAKQDQSLLHNEIVTDLLCVKLGRHALRY